MRRNSYIPHAPKPRPWDGLVGAVQEAVRDIRYAEGERGMAARGGIVLRYVAYLLAVIVVAFVIRALPSIGDLALNLVIASAALMYAAAAIGIIVYPDQRREIVAQVRFMTFGVMLFPALLLGALVGLINAHSVLPSAAPSDQALVGITRNAAPYLFWASVVVPPFIFIKTIVGMRKLHREQRDIEQSIAETQRFGDLYS